MSLHVFMTRIPSLTLQIIKSRKRLALIPTISSAIVTFSKPSDVIQSRAIQTNDQISWLSQLIEALRTLIRSIQMTIIVAPLILSAPVALYLTSYQEMWFDLLIRTIQACGPVYVKLGQWASTRRDLFPNKLCHHLSKLQNQAKVHSWNHTCEILENNKLSESFEDFDTTPIGSGCCAQVYYAKYKSEEVAVKVLHPDIKSRFLRDLTVLRSIVNSISWLFPQLRWLSIKESLEEFAKLMNIQVDLRNEAESLLKFHHNFKDEKNVIFPKPILELCTEQVLVESFEHGISIGTLIQDLDSTPIDSRKRLAAKGVDMFLKMVFRHNFVHCDLHPGNILVSSNDEKLIILDPGLTASLSNKDMRNFRAVFSAVVKGDGKTVGEEILAQSEQQCENPQEFINEIEKVVVTARSQLSLAKIDVSDLLNRVFNVLRWHQVKMEPNFTSVIIAIMVLEGLGRTLDPEMDLLWAAAPFLVKDRLFS